jgi:ketosteroid isomerase-like protein
MNRGAANSASKGGRSAAHRIAVRWPGLAHLTTASVLSLPVGLRLRRTLLERAARAAYELWNSDNFRDVAKAAADPDIEVHLEEGADLPVGLEEIYYGPDGYCQAMADWADSWRSWRIEIEDVVEVAQDKVLVVARHVGEGLASGAPIEQRGAALYTFRSGKILRVDAFLFSDEESISEAVDAIVTGSRAPR